MSDLIDDPAPGENAHEYTVSEISGAVRRVIEGEFGRVRVRGEVGRVFTARSGHLYFDIKDDRSVLASVTWKGQVGGLTARPEEGMEVVATGRLTTFGSQSKYQLTVDDLRPAGMGALMAMLEKRRAAFQAEGLFDAARKRALPFLPDVIGVVTSPQGAVIRDILHRLADRFPRQVLVWPVAVQGPNCAAEVAAAIAGFDAMRPGGPVPRPDLVIVARGGGSIEDLWGFNEEIVVRAAAACTIPLISAVGHETDTTLIDHVSDHRAPTPTAAAERAVPVRADLLAVVADRAARLTRATAQGLARRRQRLGDLSRALPRPEALLSPARQRLDNAEMRLPLALRGVTRTGRARLAETAAILRPATLRRRLADAAARRDRAIGALAAGRSRSAADRRARLDRAAGRLSPRPLQRELARRSQALSALEDRRRRALAARLRDGRTALAATGDRLSPRAVRLALDRRRDALEPLAARLVRSGTDATRRARHRLEALERLRETLGHAATLRRGYAVVRADGNLVTRLADAASAALLEIEFQDGRLPAAPAQGDAPANRPRGRARAKPAPPEQGTLL